MENNFSTYRNYFSNWANRVWLLSHEVQLHFRDLRARHRQHLLSTARIATNNKAAWASIRVLQCITIINFLTISSICCSECFIFNCERQTLAELLFAPTLVFNLAILLPYAWSGIFYLNRRHVFIKEWIFWKKVLPLY